MSSEEHQPEFDHTQQGRQRREGLGQDPEYDDSTSHRGCSRSDLRPRRDLGAGGYQPQDGRRRRRRPGRQQQANGVRRGIEEAGSGCLDPEPRELRGLRCTRRAQRIHHWRNHGYGISARHRGLRRGTYDPLSRIASGEPTARWSVIEARFRRRVSVRRSVLQRAPSLV